MRAKLVTILAVLLLAAMCFGFGAAFAAEGESVRKSEVGISSVSHKEGATEVEITILFDGLLYNGRAVHMARENEATVIAVNGGGEAGAAVLDSIKECGLRDSVQNKLFINGKSVAEMIAANKAGIEAGGDYDGKMDVHIEVSGEATKMRIVINKTAPAAIDMSKSVTLTIGAGFCGDVGQVPEEIGYTYNPQLGLWEEKGSELPELTVIGARVEEQSGETKIRIVFSGQINKEKMNNIARETEGTVSIVNGQEKLDNIKANGLRDSVRNNIIINGNTVAQLISANIEAGGDDPDGKFDVHMIDGFVPVSVLRIHIKDGSAADELIGSGDISVKVAKGFHSDYGKISQDIEFTWTRQTGSWTMPAAEKGLAIASVVYTDKRQAAEKGYEIKILFDDLFSYTNINNIARDNAGTIKVTNGGGEISEAVYDYAVAGGLRDAVRKSISVNGATIEELVDANMEEGGNDPDGALDVYILNENGKTAIRLNIKNEYAAGQIADFTKNATLKIAADEYGMGKITEDVIYSFDPVLGMFFDNEGTLAPVTVTDVSHKHNLGNNDDHVEFVLVFDGLLNSENALHMARDEEATVIAVNGGGDTGAAVLDNIKANGLRASVWQYLQLNGKSVREMMDMNKEEGKNGYEGAVDVHVRVYPEKNTTELTLHVKDAFAAGVDWDNDILITVKAGFRGEGVQVKNDVTFTYDQEAQMWLAPGEEPPAFDAVTLVGLDAPVMKDAASNKNVEFVLRFSEDIDNRQHAYISMPADFVGSFVGSSADYSETELKTFTKYGVFDTMSKNICLNGKSVYDMIQESNYEYSQWPNVAVVHSAQGGTGNNTLRLVIGGEYTEDGQIKPRPFQITDLNQNFVITVKAGLRTPLGQEVKEDISFIYDPASGKWYEGSTVDVIPQTVTVTFMDGENVLSTQECLKGETVVAGIARKEGYTFEGWYTDAEFKTAWDDTAPVNENIVVYAKFVANQGEDKDDAAEKGGCSGVASGSAVMAAVALVAVAGVLTKRRSVVK